ncbi:MAG: FAD:protein FMN transferase [Phycisphaerales bacterium]|nr:FAD:protein FMN transferase [Phycisphaerales bacterium]
MFPLATHAMGTRFELVLGGEESSMLRAVGELALREVEHWHERLSRFRSDSDVARLNRGGGGRVDTELCRLLALCESVHQSSGGAFDACLGALMERLGFHPRSNGRLAGSAETDRRMVVDPELTRVTLAPGASLDLGAVAKGFALDRAAEILLEHGVGCALLHGGTSSVVALGAPKNAEGWRIAVRSEGQSRLITLSNQAMSVSAPRGRTTFAAKPSSPCDHPFGPPTASETEATHILDPRTGRPARAADTAVVIGPLGTAALCDAWSTALVVLGSRPATMPPELTCLLHAPGTGWCTHTALIPHAEPQPS